jgi:hypothetical protein
MTKKFAALLLPLLGLVLTGCTYNRGLVVSSADRGPNDKVVGIVSGQSEKDTLFGLFQSGDDSLDAAMRDALSRSKVPAQGLINVFAEKYCSFYPFYSVCGTKLTGAAIQYSDLGNQTIPKVAANPDDAPLRMPDEAAPHQAKPTDLCRPGESLINGSCHPIPIGR